MGWFESKEGLTLGDTPLDEMRKFLQSTAKSYRDALKRPPTVDEIAATLRIVLNGIPDDDVGGLEGQEITELKFKTKKRPKKAAWVTGDVFAVPLPDGTYGFGRIIWRKPPKSNTLVEFFRHRAKQPVFLADPDKLKRVAAPMATPGISTFEDLRWPILSHDPDFRAPDHDRIRQYTGVSGDWQIFNAEFKTVEEQAKRPPDNATDMNRFRLEEPKVIEKFLLDELKKAGL